MPLSKPRGNMYDWVTHTWSCLQGECPHHCSYCYVANGHWTKGSPAYQGPPRLEPNFDKVKLGRDRTIFVAHTSDLFASGVPHDMVTVVLTKCSEYPLNDYIFQTKDPGNAWQYLDKLPVVSMIGTTIETNSTIIEEAHSMAPSPKDRAEALSWFRDEMLQTFITIEPIMTFSLQRMLDLIHETGASWVNIGADSKGCNLPEPTWGEVQALIQGIKDMGIEVRQKSNLKRLKKVV
jgi:DNA repair photolyase